MSNYKVCDICGKEHGPMREYNGKIIGNLSCWRDMWLREWVQWETARYRKNQNRLNSTVEFARAKKFSPGKRADVEEEISTASGE